VAKSHDGSTTSPGIEPWLLDEHRAAGAREASALAIVWSAVEPHRIGEVALLDGDGAPRLLGRGVARLDDPAPRLAFVRQRPGQAEACGPLEARGISRHQLLLTARGPAIAFERRGSARVLLNGHAADTGVAQPGDTLSVENQLVLYCARRTSPLPVGRTGAPGAPAPFGAPDADGIVGESVAAWALRDEIAFTAASSAHVLILGESGTGKELVARALHRRSTRGAKPLVARSAVSLPDTLIDAELFGHARDYPNAGMPMREGLLGAADGTSLFLDEIGELPHSLQAHLLRVMDAGGHYHRLGESSARRSDVRFIAATNRPLSALKEDFGARFALHVHVPPLAERREDVPLLCHHVVETIAARSPELCAPFVAIGPTGARFHRFDPTFMEGLVRHPYVMQVRELTELLWASLRESQGPLLQRPRAMARGAQADAPPATASGARPEPTADEIRAALARHGGNQSKAYLDLGLSSRYALRRLLKKHRIDASEERGWS
jgi:two-component system nitrogen regulation response regulator GlnG/two-component system response regulator HydG